MTQLLCLVFGFVHLFQGNIWTGLLLLYVGFCKL